MVDLNGIYYPGLAPPSGISQLTPSMMYGNVAAVPEHPQAGPSSQTLDGYHTQAPPHSTHSMHSAHSVGNDPSYEYQSLNNYGALSMQDNVMPPYGAPGMQYEPAPGQAELYALQQGGFGTGMPMDNMYDQNQWERMMAEMNPSTSMGYSTSNVRVNGGSFSGPQTA